MRPYWSSDSAVVPGPRTQGLDEWAGGPLGEVLGDREQPVDQLVIGPVLADVGDGLPVIGDGREEQRHGGECAVGLDANGHVDHFFAGAGPVWSGLP